MEVLELKPVKENRYIELVVLPGTLSSRVECSRAGWRRKTLLPNVSEGDHKMAMAKK